MDAFGVGTQLATSADAPAMSTIYKLVELDVGCGIKRFTAKLSHDKTTLPGAKQLFRFDGHDILARSGECSNGQAMLRPVLLGGKPGRAAAGFEHRARPCRRRRSPNCPPRCTASSQPSRGRSDTARI